MDSEFLSIPIPMTDTPLLLFDLFCRLWTVWGILLLGGCRWSPWELWPIAGRSGQSKLWAAQQIEGLMEMEGGSPGWQPRIAAPPQSDGPPGQCRMSGWRSLVRWVHLAPHRMSLLRNQRYWSARWSHCRAESGREPETNKPRSSLPTSQII